MRPRVHVKYDTGMGRLGERDPDAVLALVDAVAADERLELAGLWTHFATADEPDSDFFDEQLERFAAAGRAGARRAPRRAGARGQQRRDPARAGLPLRHGPLRGRDLRPRPVQRDPSSAGSSRHSSCAPTSPTSSAFRPGRAPATGGAGGRRRHLGRGAADRLRRRGPPRADQQRRGAGRRPPLPAGRHGLDGQHDDRPRARRRGRARRAGGADRRPGRRADPLRGGGAAGSETINYEVTCGISARVPRRARPRRGRERARSPSGSPPLRRSAPAGRRSATRTRWIVGGAVRDAALGREVERRRPRGRRRRRRGGPRDRARRRRADVPALRGVRHLAGARPRTAPGTSTSPGCAATDRGDLALRDFTVNAIAVPLATGGAAVDPHGGLADLEARRAARGLASAASPTTRCGCCGPRGSPPGSALEIDPGTVALARAEAERAAEPAGERQFAELRLLLAGADPLRGLELLDELGATAAVLPELEALRGVEQNPNHHLDVHGHTIEVLARLLEVEARPRALRRRRGRRGPRRCSPSRSPTSSPGAARCASRALFHDIGKPATRGQSEAAASPSSATIAPARGSSRELCRRLRASRRARPTTSATHPQPPAPRLPGPRAAAVAPPRLRVPARHRAGRADVTLLTVADRLAAQGERDSVGGIEAHWSWPAR